MRSTMTLQPGLHSLYSTGSGGAITGFTGFAANLLANTFETFFFAARLGRTRLAAARARARRAAAALPDEVLLPVLTARAVLVARMTSALAGPPVAATRM